MALLFEASIECRACKGTGLYVGFAEKDGHAVICSTCKSTGNETVRVEGTLFTERNIRIGIKKVHMTNPGIGIGDAPGHDFGGISYREWREGKPFERGTEDRQHTCPAWFYQSADHQRKPDWKECLGCNRFGDCPSFKDKKKCWARFDKERL